MPTLIYSMSVSLDGHIAGPDGAIDWAAPDEELMRFHNEQTRDLTGHLTGRGLYEDMLGWETAEQTRTEPRELEFARHLEGHPESGVLDQLDDGGKVTPAWRAVMSLTRSPS